VSQIILLGKLETFCNPNYRVRSFLKYDVYQYQLDNGLGEARSRELMLCG